MFFSIYYNRRKNGTLKSSPKKKNILILAAMVLLGANIFCAPEKTEVYDLLMKTGSVAEIKKALKKDSKMSDAVIGAEKDTLLMRAIMYNREIAVVNLLLKSGVSVKKENENGQNALMYACMYSKRTDVIEKILSRTITSRTALRELNRKDKNGTNALRYAKEFENRKAIDSVAKYVGKPENYQEGQDYVEFLEELNERLIQQEKEAEERRRQEAEEQRLREEEERQKAAELEKARKEQEQLEQKKNEELQKELENQRKQAEIPASKPIDMEKYDKVSLFDFVVQEEIPAPEETEESETLQKIEEPDKKDRNGRTALMLAAKNGENEKISLLVKSGAEINLADNDGWTALMNAARYQSNPETAKILLDAGADPLQKNKYGSNALQLAAAYSESPEILRLIAEASEGNSDELFRAFILAITSNSADEQVLVAKAQIFIGLKVPVNRFYEGRTPLMYAAEYSSHTEIIKFLLENGASKKLHSTDGKTAFDFAESNKLLKHDKIFWSLNQK